MHLSCIGFIWKFIKLSTFRTLKLVIYNYLFLIGRNICAKTLNFYIFINAVRLEMCFVDIQVNEFRHIDIGILWSIINNSNNLLLWNAFVKLEWVQWPHYVCHLKDSTMMMKYFASQQILSIFYRFDFYFYSIRSYTYVYFNTSDSVEI